MQPLFESNSAAAAIFWVVFFGWGALEWGGTVAEARRLRRAGLGRSREDKGTAGQFFLAIYGGIVLAFIAAYNATWAAVGGPRWLPFGVGIAMTVAGVVIRQWAILTLGPLFTRQVRIQEGHTVVTNGPYRLVRHPSYAGGLLSDFGLGLALGNWLSIVAYAGPILAVMIRRIRVEEDALRDGLGGAYDQYAAGRARLIPGVW